jgi:glutamyl-tRNA reductase
MPLILIGLNHRTAPIEVRERLSFDDSSAAEFLGSARSVDSVRGASILSTCNRVETVVSCGDENAAEALVDLLVSRSTFRREEVERHLYILRNAEVVRHLFRVASGLDSMILGEPQIGGQVRGSYQRALTLKTLDPILTQLYETTLRVAKKVRSDTGIGEHAVSIPFAAVELAKKIFGDLEGLQILLVGAGKMGELTAQHLHGFGLKKVFVANRAFQRATELAERFEGEAIRFESVDEHLASCDIVITSTAAPHYVLEPEQISAALETRRRKSLFLIDLSVPRNIDPAVAEVEGAYLYNVDDLKEVADSNRQRRAEKAVVAEEIIEREVEGFLRRLAAQDAVPTILELQTRLEDIRKGELDKCLRRLGPITAEQQQAIEILSSSIINKVAHYPILRLKETAAAPEPEERETVRQTIRKIFGLG